jgi:hypothetical protein
VARGQPRSMGRPGLRVVPALLLILLIACSGHTRRLHRRGRLPPRGGARGAARRPHRDPRYRPRRHPPRGLPRPSLEFLDQGLRAHRGALRWLSTAMRWCQPSRVRPGARNRRWIFVAHESRQRNQCVSNGTPGVGDCCRGQREMSLAADHPASAPCAAPGTLVADEGNSGYGPRRK